MSAFRDALNDLHDFCDEEFSIPGEFNGQSVKLVVTPIDLSQSFGAGGYTELPSSEISIARADYNEYCHKGTSTISKDRFLIDGKELRVLHVNDDPVCPWVRCLCGAVDN